MKRLCPSLAPGHDPPVATEEDVEQHAQDRHEKERPEGDPVLVVYPLPLPENGAAPGWWEPLLAQGAVWAESPAALAKQQVEALFTMLSSPEAVQAVALGDEGFLDHLAEGAVWVDCTTINPSFSRHMAAQAAERQVRFLDAPVAGSKAPAEQGELLFLVGGDAADVEACRPLFEAAGVGANLRWRIRRHHQPGDGDRRGVGDAVAAHEAHQAGEAADGQTNTDTLNPARA